MVFVRHVLGARRVLSVAFAVAVISSLDVSLAFAQSAAFKQAVAEAARGNAALAEFYRGRGYEPIWTGKSGRDRQRRRALLEVLEGAPVHGLPRQKYSVTRVEQMLRAARTPTERGALDVQLSELFLDYADAVATGVLTPSRVNPEIFRRDMALDTDRVLNGVMRGNTARYMKGLQPQSPEYARLLKAKIDLEKIIGQGTWGAPVRAGRLEPGMSGQQVVALRDRLQRMGYMGRSASSSFDTKLTDAVRAFQAAHGLAPDGIVGAGTLEEINTPAETRLAQVVVALERERWTNFDRGSRHVLVNIPDYSARIFDNGKETFYTRAVVGQNKRDHRTPEFSDEMEFMEVNPSWYVPRSIMVKEYLPLLQENPNAVSHLQIRNRSGQMIDRSSVDFAAITPASWNFSMREPPSQGNALGRVKFMFPNRHNIYLHDTPQKSLFQRERRAYSHGCIRLADPFGFAHALLARQSNDPEGKFKRALQHSAEVQIDLTQHVPVHLIYRTALTTARGDLQFRRDIYGRDAQIFRALQKAGVELRASAS
ncbi:MAG: L,D-transpeptidase family protein [Pseudomonadota bacterium]